MDWQVHFMDKLDLTLRHECLADEGWKHDRSHAKGDLDHYVEHYIGPSLITSDLEPDGDGDDNNNDDVNGRAAHWGCWLSLKQFFLFEVLTLY